MKKNNIYLILFVLLFNTALNSQPYYYTAKYELVDSAFENYISDIYRINMSNPAVVETLLTNVKDIVTPKSDEYGNWIAYEDGLQLTIMNLNNPNQKNIISEYCEGTMKLSYAIAENELVMLYLGDYPNPYKLVLVDPVTLTLTDTIPYDIRWECSTSKDIIFSKSGGIMYLMKTDTVLQKRYIASYSLSSKQITKTKYIEELSYPGADEFYFDFRRNGFAVIENYINTIYPNKVYTIYFLDKDSLSINIEHRAPADGYVAGDGKYFLIFTTQLTSDSLNLNPTGKIDIYAMTDGELKKTIQLPPGGKVMCFENYPNNVYYVKDIELPTRQVWDLNMDSIFQD